jgi:hypothetical protein
MSGSDAQVRALDTLARLRLDDREILEELARLFPLAKSVNVQRAIAGILIRSDYRMIARPSSYARCASTGSSRTTAKT